VNKRFLNISQLKYVSIFNKKLGWHIPFILLLSVFVAVLDGIGLTLFIPLFQLAETGEADASDLGRLGFLVDFFKTAQFSLSLENVLLLMLSLFAVKAIVIFLDIYYFSLLQYKFMRQFRIRMVEGLCNVSYSGFTGVDIGRVQNVITSEMGGVSSALSSYIGTLQTLVTFLGYLTLALIVNFWFALLVILFGSFTLFIYQHFNNKVEGFSLKQSQIYNRLQGKMMELVWHYKFLKATNLIVRVKDSILKSIKRVETLAIKTGKLGAISGSLSEPISIALIALVMFIQVVLFDVSMFTVILSLVFIYRSITSLLSLQIAWQGFLGDSGSVRVVTELYEELKRNEEQSFGDQIKNLDDDIKFSNVVFAYTPISSPVLNGVSLSIKKNSTVAFVGESGAGKTTILNLLAGLIFAENGKVLIDGELLKVSNAAGYRNLIGYITQEPVIFNNSLYNNVTLGAEKSPQNLKKFWEVIDKTALNETVAEMPNAENTILGDNGIRISGGQKQRVCIARELFRDCALLLMDEATSALDSENEAIVQNNINALRGKLTIVLIAHRLSTVKGADVIYVLENGNIAASGTFSELIENSPTFRKMVEMQGL
jgi:ABC-type multidrug transport system fused ATPase/permease subunit